MYSMQDIHFQLTMRTTESISLTNKYEAQLATKWNLGSITGTLTSANLNKLTTNVEQLNSKNIIKKVSVIGTLTAHYGDDSLAKVLLTVEKQATDPAFKNQIHALRTAQMTMWKKGGNSVDDVINLLKIREDGAKVIASRKMEVLDDYIKFVNPKNYDQTSLAKTLSKTFGTEDKVLALLRTAKANGHTPNHVENSLMSKLQSEGQLPANVYQWRKLYDNVNEAFTADNLNKFTKYVDDFNLKDPSNKKSALTLYTNSFGDAAVAKKLVAAVGKRDTSSIAKKLQSQQLEGWINSGKSVDDMFTTLKIDIKKGVTSWQLDVLEKFIMRKNGEQNVIKILSEKFGGNSNLATIVERSSKPTKTSALQKKQFAALVDKNIRPENFMSDVFKKVPDSATDEQKRIAAKFEEFYQSLSRE
ncbi:Secreted RxLR effector peptide protein [Phytophthora palmivora]|uniref:Secreted RxLR effector peptide protein n=1 Tax=Phytophthora palmivora TaxID=4796 RepID=A0A2P4YQJ9_9STRA|nr:Secreted RxLR effector peptide protein [Phytophthora palmivora]